MIYKLDSGGDPNIFMMEAANALQLDHPPLLWGLIGRPFGASVSNDR